MKIALILSILLFTGACVSEPKTVLVTKTRQVVIMPDFSMYSCPAVPELPQTKNLTDIQVAKLFSKLYQNNSLCYDAMQEIKFFLEKARQLND